jgi:hypothetical protein
MADNGDESLGQQMVVDGKKIAGWTLEEYLGSGASAMVFRGRKDQRVAAVKVYKKEISRSTAKPISSFGLTVRRSLLISSTDI